jgi:diguanylate cyclase (GGDEF)-like protein
MQPSRGQNRLFPSAFRISAYRPVNAKPIAPPELHRALLDALPDAVFVWAVDQGTLRPFNRLAHELAGKDCHGALECHRCLPEADIDRLQESPDRWLLTRFAPYLQVPREVAIHARPLEGSDRKYLLLVRPLPAEPAANDLHPGDALDDAYHDPLTRLPNRRLFERRLQRAIERAKRGYDFAVLFVDLDDFKAVNDKFGHLCGDRVLLAAARRLVESIRPQDMVARRDGDEFTILLDDLEQPSDAIGVAERIVQQLQTPLSVEVGGKGLDVRIGASIGIATSREGAFDADSLLSRADAAMYRAKQIGGGTYFAASELAEAEIASPARTKPLPR